MQPPIVSPSVSTEPQFRLVCSAERLSALTAAGGSFLHQLRHSTGALIHIDSSASPSDRIIQISPDPSQNPNPRSNSSPSPPQTALLRVFERIVMPDGEREVREKEMVACRLLAPSNQIGSVLGKGGKIVERLRQESGAQIRVFGKEHGLPLFVGPGDELIHENPNPRVGPPVQEVVFRILCSIDKVGGIIGKGGVTVRALQSETGACIKIVDPIYDSDERIIVISARESSESKHSPAQEAVLRVHSRLSDSGNENVSVSGSNSVCARLLVPAQQIGCLLGKGGSIIAEMRKATGASIRIFVKEQVPRCALPNDEVVQVTGSASSVHEALVHITGRIRESIFPLRSPSSVGPTSQFAPLPPPLQYAYSSSSESGGLHNFAEQPSPRPLPERNLRSSESPVGPPPERTKTEVTIPNQYLGFVYGENCSDLAEITKISGAKISIEDSESGERIGRVVIYGTPEQTKAAQSLLIGLIFCGVFSPS